MSDAARKRTVADWVVKTKKQVVKLYAVTKWARDAETVQKCMVGGLRTSLISADNYARVEYHRIPHEPEPAIRERNWRTHLFEGKSGSRKVRLHIPSHLVIS
jgi:UDP-galactopyranose mutase